MTTPNTKDGITKDSTLIINVPQYLSNNFKQILNYVGYWKWDSTNQIFIQVLNNQDIIDEKYNLKIEPLFYDADTGLPQKVTINSGNTKRLKMVNDNNDGAMEATEYIENNTMVRFNSKTRSVTEYPYFEVESLPPTISTPITYNGYYKFDGNTLIPGTDQDYNIYVNIPHYTININNIYQKMSNGSYSKINLNYTQNPINDVTNYDLYFYLKNFVDHVELGILAEYGIDINENVPGDCYYATGGFIGQYQEMILDLYVLENENYRNLINYNLGTGGNNSTGTTIAYYYNTQLITA